MENASKALIIAGAILLSILLISLGILVYNQANDTIGKANLNSEEIQTFNNKITPYCGNNKTYKEMNALVDAISSVNGAQNELADQHYIKITVEGENLVASGNTTVDPTGNSDTFNYPTFSAGKKYQATASTNRAGYITEVKITVAGSTTGGTGGTP